MKVRWQVKLLRRICPDIVIFIDEPYLSSFGSAFINLSREQVLQYLGEVIEAVHQEDALAGVHCCGNTDWTLLMEARADIINFDACEYFQGVTLYIDPLKDFLQNGGILAWGIVPTSAQAEKTTADELLASFQEKAGLLITRGINKEVLFRQSLLTPSCGMGTLSVGMAERVLSLLSEVSQKARKQIPIPKAKKVS
jgi:methionine synthase II (cobalamin-independent)